MLETISRISLDFVPSTVHHLLGLIAQGHDGDPAEARPGWAQSCLGTDDLPDAYRACPVAESDTPCRCDVKWHVNIRA